MFFEAGPTVAHTSATLLISRNGLVDITKSSKNRGPWELVHEEKFATRIETCECTGDWIHERDARLIVNVVIG
jgi:hypothetical protein